MKKIFQYAVFLTFIGVSSAETQVVTRGERPVLDSVSQSYHDAIILVRDTMLTVRGAASRASRDLRGTAYEVVVNRIGRLRRACDAASVLASEQVVVFDQRAAEPRATSQGVEPRGAGRNPPRCRPRTEWVRGNPLSTRSVAPRSHPGCRTRGIAARCARNRR